MTTGRPSQDWFADFASLMAIVGAFAQVLPAIATIMAIAWYTILILESRTIQRLRRAPVVDEEEQRERAAVSGEVAKEALVPEKHEGK